MAEAVLDVCISNWIKIGKNIIAERKGLADSLIEI